MGVLGLTPFLQKALQVPDVVKQLPDRLRGFAGKKIVIDGTLITQRLHFAQVPHNYRHVLGWYKLVKELQDCGVEAICVFDGKERSAAKAREAERRREVKELAVARGSIELERVKRLQRLADVLGRFQKFDPMQRGRVSELLRQISVDPNLPPALASFREKGRPEDRSPKGLDVEDPLELKASELSLEASSSEDEDVTLDSPSQTPPDSLPPLDSLGQSQGDSSEITSTYDASESTIESSPAPEPPKHAPASMPSESMQQDEASTDLSPPTVEPSLPQPPQQEPLPIPSESMQQDPSADVSPPKESDLRPTLISPAFYPSSTSPTPLAPPISPLERPFPTVPQAPPPKSPLLPVQKLASLTPAPSLDAARSTSDDQREARVAYSMTKGQTQLMTDEARLWEELAAPTSAADEEVEEQVAELSYRAHIMSESYERRNNPPTTQTYDESKELLRAMGVPCIDTTGTFEAEALASSLVINGFADYVASEDTDVVIYEAPLIRNITNRSGPLMMLSGPEIRTALELDRSSFIDFALLLGTDFSQRIKNVGPVRALKFIQQHKSIERVIEVEKKFTPRVPPPAYLAEVALARLVFMTLPPVPDEKLLEQEKDDEGLPVVLQRFGLGKLLMGDDVLGFEDALQGNYFSDDPSAW
ncbi:PIN domain-like protein [Mycena galopus ATCC 62051]|nr:PIN domain-like protein [Mycena galopus ATCC 62051]